MRLVTVNQTQFRTALAQNIAQSENIGVFAPPLRRYAANTLPAAPEPTIAIFILIPPEKEQSSPLLLLKYYHKAPGKKTKIMEVNLLIFLELYNHSCYIVFILSFTR